MPSSLARVIRLNRRLAQQLKPSSGGASGIGQAAARLLAQHGATVHVLDRSGPHEEDGPYPAKINFTHCDIASWDQLCRSFHNIGHVDIAISNAGVSEETDYFVDTYDDKGDLKEPGYAPLEVNFRAVLNFVKLSLSAFKQQGPGGSIVITSSATGYSPEQSLPVYSAAKCALLGLVRGLRCTIPHTHGATVNTVAPAATITRLLPPNLAAPIVKAGFPVANADHVARAIAFAATATQDHQVEAYGLDTAVEVSRPGRYNGRGILTLGGTWTEIEEPLASLRPHWFGEYPTEITRWQQMMTDMRPHVAGREVPG